MNILFVVDSLDAGGAGRVVSRLATQMTEDGNSVSIATTSNGKIIYSLADSVQTYVICGDHAEESKPPFIKMVRKAKRIKSIVKDRNIDVVFSFLPELNIYSILAGLGQKQITIVSERNDPHVEPKHKVVRILRTLLYPFADGFVFQTDDAKAYFPKAIQKRSTVIFNPVPSNLPERYTGEQTKKFVAMGRLDKQKNYPMMIEALFRVHQVHPEYFLDIYGEGKERDRIAQLVKRLDLQDVVTLKGQSSNVLAEIRDAYGFIMSSDFEGMSNALMEALAMGLPCVSTDHPIGGAKALITSGKNGILVPVDQADQLAEAMIRLIESPDLAQSLGAEAYGIRDKLRIENIADQWITYAKSIWYKKQSRRAPYAKIGKH